MPYQLLINSDDNVTLKHVADTAGIEYQKGKGYYELTKKEAIASKKELVLFQNGNYVTDSSVDIRNICGLAATGDLNISSSDLPANTQLFIQSTATNRKIPSGIAVVFYVDGPVTTTTSTTATASSSSSSSSSTGKKIRYAINYDLLQSEQVQEALENGDLSCLFNIPVAKDWADCDRTVPMPHQLPSLWYLSNLTRTEWDAIDIQVNKVPCITNDRITRASATGQLPIPDETASNYITHQVRLEYLWSDEWSYYAVSVGMEWGILIGSCGAHPYVLTPQFDYGNSDGSSNEQPPIAICECSEKNAIKSAAAAPPPPGVDLFSYEIRVSNQQRMDALCGHLLRLFSTHCADTDH